MREFVLRYLTAGADVERTLHLRPRNFAGGLVCGPCHKARRPPEARIRRTRTPVNRLRRTAAEYALLKVDRAGHYRLAAAANEGRGDYAVNLFRNGPQQARSSKIDALSYGGLQSQRRFASQMGKESDKRDVRAAGRRVFEDAMQRRKHPRLKVGALFCVLDVQMNSGDLVSRQV